MSVSSISRPPKYIRLAARSTKSVKREMQYAKKSSFKESLLLRKAASARPTGRLARGLKPPAFSRILFQLAVQSASFLCHQLSAGGCSLSSQG